MPHLLEPQSSKLLFLTHLYHRLLLGPFDHLAVISHSLHHCLLTYFKSWKNGPERKKTALYSGRRMATLYAGLHLIPFTICFALVTINLKTTVIDAMPTVSLTALQFAAKFLEVLVQASITIVVLAFVRTHLLGESSLPFGSLVLPFRLSDLSLLWSRELWGSLTSPAISTPTRIAIGLLFPFTITLAALVGPSCAVIMIPRQISLLSGHEILFQNPTNAMYPTDVQLSNGQLVSEDAFNLTKDHVTWATNASGPNITVIDQVFTRSMSFLEGEDSSNGSILQFVATIPSTLSADGLDGFDADAFVIHVLQPYVFTDCIFSVFLGNKTPYVDFGPTRQELNNMIPYEWLMPNVTLPNDNHTFATLQRSQIVSNSSRYAPMIWSRPPLGSNSSLLMVLGDIWVDDQTQDTVIACTIDAVWAATSMTGSSDSLEPFTNQIPMYNSDDLNSIYLDLQDVRTIALSVEWAKRIFMLTIDSSTDPLHRTVISNALMCLGLSYIPANDYQYDNIVTIWNGTSWSQLSETGLAMQQYDSMIHYIDDNQLRQKGATVTINNNYTNWVDPATLARRETYAYSVSIGYNASTVTVQLALTVITLYLMLVTGYLGYSIYVGVAADSWTSVSELLTLALNSEKPQCLQHTSVGVNSLETYRQPVNIRVNTEESLEIVFDAPSKVGIYRVFTSNEKY